MNEKLDALLSLQNIKRKKYISQNPFKISVVAFFNINVKCF
jgi:hypothetical protein